MEINIIEISVMKGRVFAAFFFNHFVFLLEIKDIVQTIYTVFFNPLTPVSDQDRISPYNSITISSRLVMSVKKNIKKNIN